ncbi:hypothetical protein Q5O24_12015 [Eubacteriaceae bacterium ES3]|nr:hypothetical protein Q5O24_12015 [Eubacteriaceae bacterium ES3]
MQIIFLPPNLTIALCFILWPVIQITAAIICFNLPDQLFYPTNFFFKSYSFENYGYLYNQLFMVRKWKHLLPDGGMVWKKKGFKKKHLDNFSKGNLNRFLIESARGELTHWLAILPFWIFGLFTPAYVVWIMLIYSLAVNLPCIIVQRYNRPRILRLLNGKYHN